MSVVWFLFANVELMSVGCKLAVLELFLLSKFRP